MFLAFWNVGNSRIVNQRQCRSRCYGCGISRPVGVLRAIHALLHTFRDVPYIPTAWVSSSVMFIYKVFLRPQKRTGRAKIPRFLFVAKTLSATCPYLGIPRIQSLYVMTNEKLLSQTISFLRFPMIVGVVFIHSNLLTFDIQGQEYNFCQWQWLAYVVRFFSQVLPAISVPLFFFISGFLFFYKTDFDNNTYVSKLKSRRMTLLVPYLIWNFIGFLILLIQMQPQFESLFPMLKDYRIDISVFLKCFWLIKLPMNLNCVAPINNPFWFVRDLIILVLFTPILHWVLKKCGVLFLSFMSVIWFFRLGTYINLPDLSHQSIFFFPLGAYFSIRSINFTDSVRNAKWLPIAYGLFAVCDTLDLGGREYYYWFHNIGIIMGMPAIIYIATRFIEKYSVKPSKFLSNASFFVFAAHGLFISKFMKVVVMVVKPQQPLLVLFIYFFVPITTILICLLTYKLLCRTVPNFTKVITGSRLPIS